MSAEPLRVAGGFAQSGRAPAGASPAGDPPSLPAGNRTRRHPCYDAEAQHEYARLHLPVAPGCNLQCNFCNRKFDCSNESRPGVTSRLLNPDQALDRVAEVRSKLPNLSVVAVAGPGEPLANANRTLRTLELVSRKHPDLTLCLSTNGLALSDHLFRIGHLGIEHLTVTINMIDPEVGRRIYPWITHDGRRLTGREASHVLSQRQLEGLQAAIDRGIRCKVNSVLIPGVNDEHLLEVSRTVRDMGAFSHNVMPLVSDPAHGTYFGLTGQRGPTDEETDRVRDACAALRSGGGAREMVIMKHCRSCRADAVGLLDDDRGADFTARPDGQGSAPIRLALGRPAPQPGVLVAVATSDGMLVDEHFGKVEEFSVYTLDASGVRLVEVRPVARYCEGTTDCGDKHSTIERTVQMLADCQVVLCTKAGPGPSKELAAAGIRVVEVYDRVETAVAAAVAAGEPPARATEEIA